MFPTYGGSASVRYDLVAGTLGEDAGGLGFFGVEVLTRDRYVLLGAAGPGVVLMARFTNRCAAVACSDSVSSTSNLEGSLTTPTQRATFRASVSTPLPGAECVRCERDTTMSLPVVVNPGESFELLLQLGANGSHHSRQLRGQLSFDVPSGYAVESCQGYPSAPVATRDQRWGRVKVRYR